MRKMKFREKHLNWNLIRTGAAKYQIKDDETLYIHGLDKDAQYTVTGRKQEKDLN